NFKLFNGQGYFTASDGVNGNELWKTDGTTSGTMMVKDINPSGDSYASNLTALDDKLFFSADNGTDDIELWYTDGVGTMMVKNINPNGSSNPANFVEFNGKIYFSANDDVNGAELWVSDGTAAGTVLVKDIYP